MTLPNSCSARVRFHLCRENISKIFASAFIDMWVPIVIYAHHVLHLSKLHPSFSLLFAHSTLCVHFENSISFWLCIIWRCAMHECWSAWCMAGSSIFHHEWNFQHDVIPIWKGYVNINALPLKLVVSYLKLKLAVSSLRITLSALSYSYETTFF